MNTSEAHDFLSLACQHLAQGNLIDAEQHARSALESEPGSVAVMHFLAQTLVRQHKQEEGLALLQQAQRLSPDSSVLLLDMAHVYQSLGRITDATDCYRRCSELNPADGYVRELYSQGLLEQWMNAVGVRKIGREASKSYAAKVYSGFFQRYLSGNHVLDIGYRGGFGEAEPIVAHATGIDLGYPGYDGIHLPFADGSQDAVYSSHCLEHMTALPEVIREWFRVLKVGGYLVTTVPHQYLYERKRALPSKHPNHLHFFSPATLLATFEAALPPNHYRVRHLLDNDLFYDYSLTPATHPVGCYEIELVLQKITPPAWELE